MPDRCGRIPETEAEDPAFDHPNSGEGSIPWAKMELGAHGLFDQGQSCAENMEEEEEETESMRGTQETALRRSDCHLLSLGSDLILKSANSPSLYPIVDPVT